MAVVSFRSILPFLVGGLTSSLVSAQVLAVEVSAESASPQEDQEDGEALAVEEGREDSVQHEEISAREAGELAFPDRSREWTRSSMHTLSNGLRVVLQPTKDAAQASVCTALAVGSGADSELTPGVARVLAEILREGGYRSAAQDYSAIVRERGGAHELDFDATSTVFCTTVPRAELPLALWVAQGRFTSGALTAAELTEAVQKLSIEADSSSADIHAGHATARLRRLAFAGTPTYARPPIAESGELEQVTLAEVRQLHQAAYGAKSATVAVSGGFEPEEILPLLEQNLGQVREGERSEGREINLVRQNTQRFSMVEDASAKTPSVWYGWVLPEAGDREALQVGLLALTGGGRLQNEVLKQSASEVRLSFEAQAQTAPGLARLEVVGRGSQSLATIEQELDRALDTFSRVGPQAGEVRAAQKSLWEEAARALSAPQGRAKALSRGVLFGKSTEEVLSPLLREEPSNELSTDAVRRAVAAHLTPRLRTVIEVYPKGWKDPWQAPMHFYHIINPGESLGSIAKQYNTTVAGLVQMNKGLNQKQPIYPGDKLRVPRVQKTKEPEPILHRVKRGDTLSALALKYGIGVRDIAEANGMTPQQSIRLGEELRIPRVKKGAGGTKEPESAAPATPQIKLHEVKSGETLSGIAKKYGVSAVRLAQANGLSQKAMVRIGQSLKIPEAVAADTKPASAPSATPTTPITPQAITHRVKSGETLSGIAKKYGVTVSELTRANGMNKNSTLRAGQSLTIPKK